MMKIGDIVYYKNDWKPGRQWCLYDISSDGLCSIALIRNGKHTKTKTFGTPGKYQWNEEYLNANIVNLNVKDIERI